MTVISRRNALQAGLAFPFAAKSLAACSAAPSGATGSTATKVHVMGTIHSRHRTSKAYSLSVLEAAIRRAQPDVILTEIPPDRVETALSTFKTTGKVDEPRTNVFPEYTDVIIPLAQPENWRVVGTAAWTPEIGSARRKALKAIENDPARAAQWARHRAALAEFVQKTRGRLDDPRFIHTSQFDQLVANSRKFYAQYFDADLGAGGWTQINDGHNALINKALDMLSGQGLSVLITFGAAHKYKILESVNARKDTQVQDTAALFA